MLCCSNHKPSIHSMPDSKKIKIALVCGYSASKHGIALVHELGKIPNGDLAFVACVQTFTFSRLKHLLKRYGWRDALEKFRNVFLKTAKNRFSEEIEFIANYLVERKIFHTSVNAACRAQRIKYISISSLNSASFLNALSKNEIDILVYSGGGIVRKPIIQAVKFGVLNAHSGPLPFFRGMNSLEWTLLHGVCPEVSVHLIDAGIDTGPILYRTPIEISAGDTVQSLRGKSVVVEVESLLYCVQHFKELYPHRKAQALSEGKQFFTMHWFLKDIVNKKLGQGWRPLVKYDHFKAGQ